MNFLWSFIQQIVIWSCSIQMSCSLICSVDIIVPDGLLFSSILDTILSYHSEGKCTQNGLHLNFLVWHLYDCVFCVWADWQCVMLSLSKGKIFFLLLLRALWAGILVLALSTWILAMCLRIPYIHSYITKLYEITWSTEKCQFFTQ